MLYVDQMKYQLLSVNFFQSKTYLFTDWLVEHHTFASSTFYSFCDNILNGNYWYFIWSTYKRIRLSLEERLVKAKEMYLIPWMILETEIVFLVKFTPTTISMDHRSFGHHWTAKVYTYKYQHGPPIFWAPLTMFARLVNIIRSVSH
jgi:hypothetical protein